MLFPTSLWVLVFLCTPASPPPSLRFFTTLSHTTLSNTSLSHAQLFKPIDPPPSPLYFLPFRIWLLGKVDLWGYPILKFIAPTIWNPYLVSDRLFEKLTIFHSYVKTPEGVSYIHTTIQFSNSTDGSRWSPCVFVWIYPKIRRRRIISPKISCHRLGYSAIFDQLMSDCCFYPVVPVWFVLQPPNLFWLKSC